ncbi:hypothetical protein ACFC1T_33290 [Kitasatospora sp. NPDC056076]|uniref:hypothetical protein n=1 Tax=Kitasatospora sp. NPDC056076 TaxID=3345703 RepID=UPI0035D75006
MTHPLTSLRAALGLSQPEYARLVARTHDELGLGRMAARREKVSRWESGRIAPEFTAQLAMAHLHGVAAREVRRLGWPFWAHLATRDAALLEQPHTDEGAVTVLAGTALPPEETPARAPAPVLSGAALTGQLRGALERLRLNRAVAAPAPGADLGALTGRVAGIEARTGALEGHENATGLSPAVLYAAAHAEHRLVVSLLTRAGHPGAPASDPSSAHLSSAHPSVRRLFALAARTSLLCGWFSLALGEDARAERHGLAAVRAAAAAGEPALAARAMSQLTLHQLVAGAAEGAVTLIRAARAAGPRSPAAEATLHCFDATATARLGHASAAEAALDHAGQCMADAPADPSLDPGIHQRLSITRGGVLWYLGRPRGAAPYFRAFADTLLLPQGTAHHPHTALFLLYAVDTHLALGELDVAAALAHRALDLTGVLAPGLARGYRDKLTVHRHEPLIAHALDHLNDSAAS